MLEPIPAIDIIEGKCVRLSMGEYASKKVYDAHPLDIARHIEDLGFRRLHLVDLDGAKSSHVVNLPILRQISSSTSLKIDFGGGIKTEEDLQSVFENGAEYATIGSLAVREPAIVEEWIRQYSPEHIILGADVKGENICINGWKDKSDIRLFDFLNRYIRLGIKYILCTDISKDGLLKGTSLSLYKSIIKAYPQCHLIASGGVSCMQDLIDLDKAHIPHVVFGKAIYENKINLEEVAKYFLNK